MKKIFVLLFTSIFYACDRINEDGKDTPPNFQPSIITFDNESNSKTIESSNNQNWWFNRFVINDSLINYESDQLQYEYLKGKEHKPWNVTSVKGPWFTIRKLDQRTIYVIVSSTKMNRKVTFEAYRGDSWQTITIIQHKK